MWRKQGQIGRADPLRSADFLPSACRSKKCRLMKEEEEQPPAEEGEVGGARLPGPTR